MGNWGLFAIIMFGLVAISVTMWASSYDAELRQKHLGDKIVLGNDTLTVVSYSAGDDDYLMNDGSTIKYEHLENLQK